VAIVAVPVTRLHAAPPVGGGAVVVAVTVSAALPLTLPLVATMFVVPAATAVIKPAALTVATEGDELVHDTVCPVNTLPLASFNTVVARVVSPTTIDVRLSETEALATGAGLGLELDVGTMFQVELFVPPQGAR
jgi:hypothetical protein